MTFEFFVVNYSFQPADNLGSPHVIKAHLGEIVKILRETDDWFQIKKNESEYGIIPKSYVSIRPSDWIFENHK